VDDVKMKQKIENILEETGHKESRAAKMDLNDILKYVGSPSSLVLSVTALQTTISLP
jgi:acid phosphatase family membrane protein YuiD